MPSVQPAIRVGFTWPGESRHVDQGQPQKHPQGQGDAEKDYGDNEYDKDGNHQLYSLAPKQKGH